MKKFLGLLIASLLIFSCSPEEVVTYKLSVTVTPDGAGNVNPASGTYDENEQITINVVASPDYIFSGWSGDWSGSNTPLTLVMDSDKTLTANFVIADSDGDGVNDEVDQDNNTRGGVPVDSNGVMINPIYLDDNGVTIKAYDWSIVGDVGTVDGKEYTVVDEAKLREMVYKDEDVTRICTSKVTNMVTLFREKDSFNQDIGSWDTSNVTDMSEMYRGAFEFNQNIGSWNTSSVTSMKEMFLTAVEFNQPIGNWDTSNVTDMSGMFRAAVSFNYPIGSWDTSNVTNMKVMFSGASSFNQPIGNWDTSGVTNMSLMFNGCHAEGKCKTFGIPYGLSVFNQYIGDWDTSNVIEMVAMFQNAKLFNQDIGS